MGLYPSAFLPCGLNRGVCLASPRSGFFIFIFYIFVFYKNIFSFSKFTCIYPGLPAAGRPALGRPTAGRQGVSTIFNGENLRAGPWRTGRPAAGRPAPPPLFGDIFFTGNDNHAVLCGS